MQTEENLVNKDHHATMQIFMKNCEVNCDIGMEDDLIWLMQAEKDLIAASKFDEFFLQKFNKQSELLSRTIFVDRLSYTLIILRG